jgi:hypothetical protein
METICIRYIHGGKTFVLTLRDKTGDYLSLQEHLDYLYDFDSGDPINDRVRQMDDCILEKWNPELFEEIFNELNRNSDLRIC